MSLHLRRPTLLTSASSASMCHSTKRKRDDPLELALAPSSTRRRASASNPPTRAAVPDDDINGDRSPQSNVAGHFQNLKLTGCGYDFGKIMEKPLITSHTVASSRGSDHSSSHESSQSSESQPLTPSTLNMTLPLLDSTSQPTAMPLEIPETPRLQPTTAHSLVPSPLPRPKSPSPLNLWWADTEITGHDPTDPADDGYGINGVGFLPTPAMAVARAERRKRQVAEWKNREARDARQRRSEARRRRDQDMNRGDRSASERDLAGGQQRRVRFLEV